MAGRGGRGLALLEALKAHTTRAGEEPEKPSVS